LATEIVLATREAADIPVSVKTRTGVREPQTERWIQTLLETGPAAITLHGRTQKQMTRVPADWDEIATAVRLRDAGGYATRILGNGDVVSTEQGLQHVRRYGVEGIMVGRGIFQDPWLFNPPPGERGSFRPPTRREKLELLWRHTELYFRTWQRRKNFVNLRKFYKIYASGFPGASQLRQRLMKVQTPEEVRQLLDRHLRIKAPEGAVDS
jgi:tRNA-dihydrouridine synthase